MSDQSDISKQGEELNQLSRLFFDRASLYWYSAMSMEFFGGVAGLFYGALITTANRLLICAIGVFILLFVAYLLKIKFQSLYGTAETMRRQSILTEALNWEIPPVQFNDWIERAGSKMLNQANLQPREDNYYTTKKNTGAERLLEMTIESAFFTRHLYLKMKNWAWAILVFFIITSIIILNIILSDAVSTEMRLQIAYYLYLFFPVVISTDILGCAIKLGRLSSSIKEIEGDMIRLSESNNVETSQVLRFISEYNCQVVEGMPIPNLLFKYWHDEINDLWKKRSRKC